MAKLRDEVLKAVKDVTARLGEIKNADEEDLGKIAAAFDEVSQKADEHAERFHGADQVLGGGAPAKSDES